MKNLQKGFVVPLVIAVIAVLAIGGGVYVYQNKKVETSAVKDTEIQQSNQTQQQTNTQTPVVNTQQKVAPTPTSVSTPTINITSPNGGEVWSQNSQYTIGWSYSGLDKNDEVYIGFRLEDGSGIDKGVCWLSEKSSAGRGSITVTPSIANCNKSPSDPSSILSNLKSGGRFKVQIGVSKYSSGMGVADHSDSYFTILAN